MNHLPEPDNDYDARELERLNVEPWMLSHLALNPAYCGWSPGMDNMRGVPDDPESSDWSAAMVFESWDEYEIPINTHNVVASFYFELERDSEPCTDCPEDGGGYNAATSVFERTFYGDPNRVEGVTYGAYGWRYRLTEEERQLLIAERRISPELTLEDLNRAPSARPAQSPAFFPDAISRHILVEHRAKQAGVYGMCPSCDGHRYIYTAPAGHLNLVLWILHPRKGASRGVTIRKLSRDDARAARAYLREAARSNAERFAQLEDPCDATLDEDTSARYQEACETGEAWLERAGRWRDGGIRKAATR